MNRIIQLLRVEWIKYRQSSIFILLGSLYMITLPLSIWGFYRLYGLTQSTEWSNEEGPLGMLASVEASLSFPRIWEYVGYLGSWSVTLFIGFLGIIIITSEVQNKTLRQSIINGLTRKEYFTAKVGVLLAISTFCTVFYTIVCLGLGTYFAGGVDRILEDLWAIPRYFLMCMGYLSFAFALGIVLRKSGFALFSYLAYVFMFAPLLRILTYYKLNETIQFYFPLNVIEDVTPLPLFRVFQIIGGFQKEAPVPLKLLEYSTSVPLALLYTLMYLGVAYWFLKKRDI